MPHFTVDHFSNRIRDWDNHVTPNMLSRRDDLHWLEVGSFEGQSALWCIENFLTGKHDTITCIDVWDKMAPGIDVWGGGNRNYHETFCNNLRHHAQKVTVLNGRGLDVMPHLISQGKKYHGGYLDSDHCEEVVRKELALMWQLMLPGAVVVVDDYGSPADPGCKVATDEFIADHENDATVLHRGFTLILLKNP